MMQKTFLVNYLNALETSSFSYTQILLFFLSNNSYNQLNIIQNSLMLDYCQIDNWCSELITNCTQRCIKQRLEYFLDRNRDARNTLHGILKCNRNFNSFP